MLALCIRKEMARPGMLYDRGFAAGEIANRPVATPRILQLHAGRLRAANLATRLLDICTLFLGGGGHLVRILAPPAIPTPELPLFLFGVTHGQRQLQWSSDARRKLGIMQKGLSLFG